MQWQHDTTNGARRGEDKVDVLLSALLTELVESELATKHDIEALRSQLKRDLKELDLRFS